MIREAREQSFTVSAPRSVCLFGEELAPLGLRTIQMAVNMRVYVRAEALLDSVYRVEISDENRMDEFEPTQCVGQEGLSDPLHRAVHLLGREGLGFERGFRFEIKSELPPECGLGYSAAVRVAWVTAILQLHDKLGDCPAQRIAQIAYDAASVDEAKSSRIADYLASAAGGIHAIDHGKGNEMSPIARPLDDIIIADTELEDIPLPDVQRAAAVVIEAQHRLKEIDAGLDFGAAETDEIMALLRKLPDDLAAAAYAVVVDRDTTEKAYRLLTQDVFDQDAFGELMDTHHEMLRDHLGIAVPQIDRLIEVGKLAGALGGKLNGPRGRTATLYAPGRTQPVLAALREASARPHIVTKTHGVAFEGL